MMKFDDGMPVYIESDMLNEINKLRDDTKIGEIVMFEHPTDDHPDSTIIGSIVKKYPYIFLLDDGHCYQWSDLYFSRKEVNSNGTYY